jgi:Ca-activated chloride channel homolog
MKYAAMMFGILGALLATAPPRTAATKSTAFAGKVTQGALLALDREGRPSTECPLKHTDVQAEISGMIARVTVTQEFRNDAADKIEAVYVFPLSQNSAVDEMTMHVGSRTVKGLIKKREEARAIYENAKNSGRVASLLDQERPNIFTQSVANIMPGETVKIVIRYVEHLKFDEGTYEFVFPMVVGPRYIPGTPTGTKAGGGWAYDTNQVPDASKITPPVAVPGTRAGHDIDVKVTLDAGMSIDAIQATTHEVDIQRPSGHKAIVSLRDKQTLPNKDFILRYDIAGKKIKEGVLAHNGPKGGYFTLMVQPPDRPMAEDITPKELVFVLDTSGSMHGFPIEKAKESMRAAIRQLNPLDTFNLITFAGDTRILWPKPVPATQSNVEQAIAFMNSHSGGGGTEMMKAIRASLEGSGSQQHVRIVCFMTDGYVGNEAEIIREIQQHSNARVFSFGIGSSVNRYLLDKMAEVGRGEVEYVGLSDDGSAAAKRFAERVRNPLLTDIQIEWNGLPVSEVYPQRVPDLFSAKPLVLSGRFSSAASGVVRVRGKVGGRAVTRELAVNFPASEPANASLATLWARRKVDALMHQGERNAQEEITQLGLQYSLMTPFTSFVAVEQMVVTDGGTPRRVDVPVEMPEGVSYDHVFGPAGERKMAYQAAASSVGNGAVFAPRSKRAAPAPVAELDARKYPREFEASARDDARRVMLANKIHPSLANKTGRVSVQIRLKQITPDLVAKLKALGFETLGTSRSTNVLLGKVDAAKLKEMAALDGVVEIRPL